MRLIVTLVVFCLSGALAARAQTGPLLPYKSAHWKQSVTFKGATPDKTRKVAAEIWYLGPDRMRVVFPSEGKMQVILIKSGTALTYEEGSNAGIKMPLQQQLLDMLAQITEIFTKVDSWKKSKVATETVGDKKCDVYVSTETAGGQTVNGKLWLWPEKNFPIRMVAESQGQSMEVEHSDIDVNGEIPAAIFDPPPKMKFIEAPPARGAAK